MALDELQQAERAARIKQLREESPYTQEALADKLGITVRAYQAWEEGGGIKWENLEHLAELHDVEVYWIHKGQERGPTPELFPASQLNDIEDKLDEILERLPAEEPAAEDFSDAEDAPDQEIEASGGHERKQPPSAQESA